MAEQRSRSPVLRKLCGGDRRSIGRSEEVVRDTVASPSDFGFLDDGSSIVRTCALRALYELAQQDAARMDMVTALLQEAERSGTAAMRARARRLLRARRGPG